MCPSRKKLGLALGKVYFETTETTETKETTAKLSIIIIIVNLPAVSVVSFVPALSLTPKTNHPGPQSWVVCFALSRVYLRCSLGLVAVTEDAQQVQEQVHKV